jgi:protein-S-isoprenylcysteine O-methyltransferase Ste14
VTAAELRLKNAAASVASVALASAAFASLPVHAELLQRWHGPAGFSVQGSHFLAAATLLYAALVAWWMLTCDSPSASKSLRSVRVLMRFIAAPVRTAREGLDPADRLALLATLLKAFFAPLMVMSLMGFSMGALTHATAAWHGMAGGWQSARELFDRFGFWFLMQLILFVDVVVFTVGYLFESRRLGNHIRSVDATLAGWAAALMCYPPFNAITAKILGAQVSDFPQFDDPQVHMALNGLLLVLMACYASASVALGLKGSNLTHRGIVMSGPYRVVRHPAYVCKNLAWWIGSIPLVSLAFADGWIEGLQAVASVAGWTLLYVLRALTEEDHLRSVDGDYAAYASKVRYRFVPGLI